MIVTPLKTSFNGGILSPLMYGRTDVNKYPNSCEDITNLIPTVQGALVRRPGTRFLSYVKDSTQKTWLQSFVFDYAQAFILEFGNYYIRFYYQGTYLSCGSPAAYNGGTSYVLGDLVVSSGINYYCIQGGTGHTPASSPAYWYPLVSDIYEIPTPYSSSDLTDSDGTFNVGMVQSGDVIYMAHGSYLPQKLQRYGNTKWIMSPISTKKLPFKSNNTDTTHTIHATSLTSYVGTPFVEYSINLEASSALFTANMVGDNFLLQVTNDDVIKPWASQLNSSPSRTTSVGDMCANNGCYYGCSASVGGNQTWYVAPVHTEGGRWDGDEVQWWYLSDQQGICRIDTVTDSTHATATVLKQIPNVGGSSATFLQATIAAGDTATLTSGASWTQTNLASPFVASPSVISAVADIVVTGSISFSSTSSSPVGEMTTWAWNRCAWNEDDGYPTKVTFFKDRLVFARDQTVWFSSSGDYENFYAKEFNQILDDSAITINVPFDRVSVITYLKPLKAGLLIGSTDEEALCSAGSAGAPFSPTNIQVDVTTQYGSRSVDPIGVDNALLFVQRAGRKLRAMTYQFSTDNFIADDMTLLTDNLTQDGIIDMAWHREPWQCLWCVTTNGQLLSFTYNLTQDVRAWSRHLMGGNGFVETVQTIPSWDGTQDHLYMIVRRVINGTTVRTVERMEKPFAYTDSLENAYYVDCGKTRTGSATNTLSGLTWLANQNVSILGDGFADSGTVSSTGVLTTSQNYSNWVVGFACPYYLRTMQIDVDMQTGTGQGKPKRIIDMMVRTVNSLGLQVGVQTDHVNLSTTDQFSTNTLVGDYESLITGDRIYSVDCPESYNVNIVIYNDKPYPTTIIAISPKINITER